MTDEIRAFAIEEKHIFDKNPCDCDPNAMNDITIFAVHQLVHIVEHQTQCAIGPCTAVALALASMFNPDNIVPEQRANGREAALKFADVLDKIASHVRKRAAQ